MSGSADVFAQTPGILGLPAPSLAVTEWFNVEKDTPTPDVPALKGKVVYLYFFQAWCPGCHSSGFPTLRAVSETFANDPEVAFLAVQTVFEGFHANTVEKAKEIAKKYALGMPIGQSGSESERSAVMSRYRTGGTPWTVIIDREGKVRFNGFHIDADKATTRIRTLK